MAEAVTSNAASQLNLLAHRQQAFPVERNPAAEVSPGAVEAQDNLSIQKTAQTSSARTAQDDQPEQKRQPRREPQEQVQDAKSGPSKARVEVKHIGFGMTPSEVVGTLDVLQRFDDNGDGRVDRLESQQVQLSRVDGQTFEGLAAAPQKREVRSFAPDQQPAAETVGPANPDQHVSANKFYVNPGQPGGENAGESVGKKFFGTEETASLGSPADSEDVPRKFYGQGAEVVIGQFSGQAEASPKYFDKASDSRSQVSLSEDGTGEVKYYDKVAQTDAEQTFSDGSGDGSGSYYEKAEQVAAAIHGEAGSAEQKKYAHTELSAYTTTAGITGSSKPVVIVNPTVVTA